MVIVKVLFRGVNLFGAGGNPYAIADLLIRSIRSNALAGGWRASVGNTPQPRVWSARGPSERDAFMRLGLPVDAKIPVPLPILSSVTSNSLIFAVRGDLFERMGPEGVEEAFRKHIPVLRETFLATQRANAEIDIRLFPFEYLLENERSYYFIPAIRFPDFEGRTESLGRAILDQVRGGLANACYGWSDQSRRLEEVAFAADGLMFGGVGRVKRKQGGAVVEKAKFTVYGRFSSPFFLPWQPGGSAYYLAKPDFLGVAA